MWRGSPTFGCALASCALVLSACGSQHAGSPSSLNPAAMAPSGTIAYVSLAVRPQGQDGSEDAAALRELFGPNVNAAIQKAVQKVLSRKGLGYGANVRPWLGQRIGIAVLHLPPSALAAPLGSAHVYSAQGAQAVVIAPTQNPAAARSFLQSLLKGSSSVEGKVIGHYLVVGDPVAFQDALATTPSSSLAAQPGFQGAMSGLGSGAAATLYVNARAVARQEGALAKAGPLTPLLRQSIHRMGPHAATVAGLTMSRSAVRIDVEQYDMRAPTSSGRAPDAGSLPSDSWLALDTGTRAFGRNAESALTAGFKLGLDSAIARAGGAGSSVGALVQQRLATVEEVFRALGPLSMSVGGTSVLSVRAGLKVRPQSMPAAIRLLRGLERSAARSPSLTAQGSAGDFTLSTPLGTNVLVRTTGRSVIATYGYPSQSDFSKPGSSLASTPAYRQAAAQLPASSSVSFYMSFGPLAAIVQLTDHKPSAQRTVHVLQRLSYVIVGSRAGHTRIVLGLR